MRERQLSTNVKNLSFSFVHSSKHVCLFKCWNLTRVSVLIHISASVHGVTKAGRHGSRRPRPLQNLRGHRIGPCGTPVVNVYETAVKLPSIRGSNCHIWEDEKNGNLVQHGLCFGYFCGSWVCVASQCESILPSSYICYTIIHIHPRTKWVITIISIHVKISQTADGASISSIDLRASEFDDTAERKATFAQVDIHLTHLPQFPIWATVHKQRSPHQ